MSNKKNVSSGRTLLDTARNHAVPIMFIIICAIFIPMAGFSPSYLLNEIITQYTVMFVAEEHLKAGGIGSAIQEAVREPQKIRSIAIEDRFGQSGSVEALMQEYGLDAKAIVQRVLDDCARRLYPGDAKAAIVRQMAPAC